MSGGPDAPEAPPRADLADAIGWTALGVAVLAGSWTMDRLEDQDVPPFAAPGLLPGLLGVVLVLMGGLLMVRSVQRDRALNLVIAGLDPATQDVKRGALGALGPRVKPGGDGYKGSRALTVIALCVLFGGGLVGHGLPFWAAAAAFVTVAILFLRRGPGGEWRLGLRALGFAAAVGLGAGFGITLLFQRVFLVRLP